MHSKGIEMRTPHDLSLIRPITRDTDGVMTALYEGRTLSDEQSALTDHLCGLDSYPEAHASEHARDAKLGIDNGLVEFVSTTWAEAKAAGFEPARVAIGPAPDEQGFFLISSMILPEVIKQAKADWGEDEWSAGIIIARVQCSIDVGAHGVSVSGYPLYGGPDADARVEKVLRWLDAAVRARL
ncbi:hypothetical protein [Hansschlegelia sp. KR7-227]|uniref:hypothetical protein n=1 Tax=Hansschlegelia sp. KR7-227 TaxID=3400914 RepID=UPI003BFB120B